MKIKSPYGFTLIELIVTVAILSIVATLALPLTKSIFARLEAKKIYSTLDTLVTHAKTKAYLQHARIGICGSNDSIHCANGGWSKSILVFKDGIANRVRDNNEDLLQVIALDLKHGNLNWTGATGINLIFQPDSGLPRGSNGTFMYCSHEYSNLNMRVILSNMGHLRSEKEIAC